MNNSAPLTAENSPETVNFVASRKTSKTPIKLLSTIFAILLVSTLIFFFLESPTQLAQDLVRNYSTQTPAEIEEIVTNLKLTDKAKFIFGAVDPRLEDAETFNAACITPDASVSSLGCFDPSTQKIHIYRVESDELKGEIEATAAHELLHAAWERLSFFDRQHLEPLLLSVYNSAEYSEMLRASTENYAPIELMTELHSQIAERIKDLPPELEQHYAAYFEDQDLVVSYYEQYSSVFEQLMSEADALATEIETERVALNEQYDRYAAWVDDYNARVEAFNRCARDPDCSLINFEARRDEFIKEGQEIDAAYEAYENARVALNAKIDVYNSNVNHLKSLDYALDSRASPETTIETNES